MDGEAPLTEREMQVLRGMSQGQSNGEIGRELFLSEDTVKTHARRLFRKLGARDRAQAVAWVSAAGSSPEPQRRRPGAADHAVPSGATPTDRASGGRERLR